MLKIIQPQFIKFLLVGGINTLFGYSIYALGILLGLEYKLAMLGATVIGAFFNFVTNGRLVFGTKGTALLLRFLPVYVIIYFLNIGFIKLFLYLGLTSLGAGAVTILPVSVISYFLQKQLVFKKANNQQP